MRSSLWRPSPILLRVSVFAAASLLAGPLTAATITGVVRSADSNTPLQAMIVSAYDIGHPSDIPAASATTTVTGNYQLTLAAGHYRVLAWDSTGAWAPAFESADSFDTSPIHTLAASDTASVDFQLQSGVTISGIVLASVYPDMSGRTPTANLTVAVYNAGSGTRRGLTRTWSPPFPAGVWSMVVPPGSYKLIAYDDFGSLGPLFYNQKLTFDTANTLVVSPGPPQTGLDFSLTPSARVIGRIVDRESGNPVAGAVMYAYTPDGHFVRSCPADSNGDLGLILVSYQSYRFVVADPAGVFAPFFLGGAKSFAKSPTIGLSPSQSGGTYRLERAGIVRGRTVDRNGAAIASLTVAAYNLDGTVVMDTKSDASGAYSLSLPTGTFRIAAYDNSLAYATQFYSHADHFGAATSTSTTAGQITPGVDFAMNAAGHFLGAATDNYFGRPVSGVTVTAYDEVGRPISSATTSSSGLFNLAVPAGTFRVLAWDESFRFANSFDGGAWNFETTASRTISSDASQTVNITMRYAIDMIWGTVTANGRSVEGVAVDALDLLGRHVGSANSRIDGTFVIPVVAGSYKLFAHDAQQRYAPSFYGGSSLATATVIGAPRPVSDTPPAITIPLSPTPAPRRRPVAH